MTDNGYTGNIFNICGNDANGITCLRILCKPRMRITCPTLKPRLPTGWPGLFANLEGVVVDEWHELMGTKRGVQTELAVNWLKTYRPQVQLWVIFCHPEVTWLSQTRAGMPSGADSHQSEPPQKTCGVAHLLRDFHMDQFPWADNIGLNLQRRWLSRVFVRFSSIDHF